MVESPPPGTISTKDAAALLMIEERSVRRLAADGTFPPSVKGRYQTIPMVQGYIRYLQAERKDTTRTSAENRVRDARARDFEVRTAKAARELIAYIEAEAVQDEIVGMLRSGMVGVGASVTRDLELRRKIDAAIDAIFARVHALILEKASSITEGGEAPPADPQAEPGRVGEGQHRLSRQRGRPRTA